MQPLVLFGGSFDPVHNGHAAMVRGARRALNPQRLLVLPAGNPWQRGRLPLASASQRLTMLQLAFADDADVDIDERELHRPGPTYTLDTLRELRQEWGANVPMVWLIGEDAFAGLPGWHAWSQLLDLAHFAVIPRASALPQPRATAANEAHREALASMIEGRVTSPTQLPQQAAGSVTFLDVAAPAISSTAIRRCLVAGESIAEMVPPAVWDYIERHHLYRPETDPAHGQEKTR